MDSLVGIYELNRPITNLDSILKNSADIAKKHIKGLLFLGELYILEYHFRSIFSPKQDCLGKFVPIIDNIHPYTLTLSLLVMETVIMTIKLPLYTPLLRDKNVYDFF